MLRGAVAIGAAVLLLGGCTGGEETSDDVDVEDVFRVDGDRPPCPKAGDMLTEDVLYGCVNDEGGITALGTFPCEDGSTLWGDGSLWGRVGEEVQEVDGLVADSAEYRAAYDECQGV